MFLSISIISIVRKLKAACGRSAIRGHKVGWWAQIGIVFLLASCTAPDPSIKIVAQPGATPLGMPSRERNDIFADPATDEAAIITLILAERQAAIEKDLVLLGQLWAADARIVDGRQSVIPTDDYIWQGRAAIVDRYRVAVFPYTLPTLSMLDAGALITITGATATVQNGTDVWQLRRAEQRWWLTELYYQVPGDS